MLYKAEKHRLGVLFCLYGGNVTLLLIMRVYQQTQIRYETGIVDMLNALSKNKCMNVQTSHVLSPATKQCNINVVMEMFGIKI